MDTNNNIFFIVEDNPDTNSDKLTDVDKMMGELLDDNTNDDFNYDFNDYEFDFEKTSPSLSLSYFDEKNLYIGVPESYYSAHTIKELMKICQYYDLAKNVKGSKCKKQDIVATIVFFEAQPENSKIVNKRNKMWAYMKELEMDPKMKPYLIWT